MLARNILSSQLRKTSITRCFSSIEKDFLVINAVGPDRVGIVSGLTKLVVQKGGNVGESQASKLGSSFGLMMQVSVPRQSSQELVSAISNMGGISTSCYATKDPNTVTPAPCDGYTGRFILSGADNPGIVHKVTQVLSRNNLNIDEMKTFEESAPYGGTTLFYMNGTATSPAPLANGFDAAAIRRELAQLGDEMNCDIDLEDTFDDKFSASFYG